MRLEGRKHFPCHRGLVISTCNTTRAWRTCRDACRDRYLAVSLVWENVPGIPGACTTRNSTCLVRGPWPAASVITSFRYFYQFHSCHYFRMTTYEQILFMTMWKETSFALNSLFIRRNETYTWPLFNSFGPREKERNFTGLFKIDLFHEISCLYFD